jgi:hypothetical protein
MKREIQGRTVSAKMIYPRMNSLLINIRHRLSLMRKTNTIKRGINPNGPFVNTPRPIEKKESP